MGIAVDETDGWIGGGETEKGQKESCADASSRWTWRKVNPQGQRGVIVFKETAV